MGCSVAELRWAWGREMMQELFGATPAAFQPSIPHLVYQYDLYTNYAPLCLASPNPELL